MGNLISFNDPVNELSTSLVERHEFIELPNEVWSLIFRYLNPWRVGRYSNNPPIKETESKKFLFHAFLKTL